MAGNLVYVLSDKGLSSGMKECAIGRRAYMNLVVVVYFFFFGGEGEWEPIAYTQLCPLTTLAST